MIRADFHNHTSFSTDSKQTPEVMLEKAISLGLTSYCITDHMDYDYPDEPGSFIFDPDAYFVKISKLREQYSDHIQVLAGIELGLRNESELRASMKERYEHLTSSYPFDFIIGSTHVLEYHDPYYAPYWEHRSVIDGVKCYLESILDNVSYYDSFHVYGHLDYILRYLPEDAQVDMSEFNDLFDAILKIAISRGKGIELNTSNYARGNKDPHPSRFVLSRYRELGGDLITIGSDAHIPERIAYDFNRAERLLMELGYRYYVTFKQQKPEYHELGI